MIIHRPLEARKVNETRKWILLFGRRKTGKSFLVNNFVKYDDYFFVKTNKTILTKDGISLTYETFMEILKRSLKDKRTVVVDEFHRLGDDFFDFLHFTEKQGKLILISSTLFLSKKMISGKSTLLGLLAEIPLGLISLKDTLKTLEKSIVDKKERLEIAILLREPISVDYFNERKKARDILAEIILGSIKTIPALTGEIFLEEEREISAVYEGILRAIAMGKIGSGEISSYLFSKKLIKKDDPSIIQQYLNNLMAFGIIKRIKLLDKKKFIYKLVSPLARIFYYCDEKYNLSERNVDEKELARIVDEIMPRIVEDNIREYFAGKYGLSESVLEAEDFEIDGCLLKFNKIEIAIEVKWRKDVSKAEIKRIEKNMAKIDAKRKILFVQDKKSLKSSLDILDVDDL